MQDEPQGDLRKRAQELQELIEKKRALVKKKLDAIAAKDTTLRSGLDEPRR